MTRAIALLEVSVVTSRREDWVITYVYRLPDFTASGPVAVDPNIRGRRCVRLVYFDADEGAAIICGCAQVYAVYDWLAFDVFVRLRVDVGIWAAVVVVWKFGIEGNGSPRE